MERETSDVTTDNDSILSIDIGGTKLLFALVGPDGTVQARSKLRTDMSSQDALVSLILSGAKNLVADAGGNISAVCIGLPGIVDPDEGIMTSGSVPLTGVNLPEIFHREYGVPALAANDVTLGILGEATYGVGMSTDTVAGIFIGTGVGGGLVLDGNLYTGAHGAAGEIGSVPFCNDGIPRPLTDIASRAAVVKHISESIADDDPHPVCERIRNGEQVRSKHLRQALAEGHEPTVIAMERAGRALGEAAAALANLLDPDVVVMGGGLIEGCGAFLMPVILGHAGPRLLLPDGTGPVIMQSELGDDAVVLGAAVYAYDYLAGTQPHVRRRALPDLEWIGPGEVKVNGRRKVDDFVVRDDGSVRKRRRKLSLKVHGSTHLVSVDEVKFICKGTPRVLIVGTGTDGMVEVGEDAKSWLAKKHIRLICKKSESAVKEFHETVDPVAMLLHVRH